MPQRVKDRAEALRLSAHGWDVEKIAAYLNWAPQTVRETIHRWNSFGLGGLWEAPGRGGFTKEGKYRLGQILLIAVFNWVMYNSSNEQTNCVYL